jgi:hypothetical protein
MVIWMRKQKVKLQFMIEGYQLIDGYSDIPEGEDKFWSSFHISPNIL